MLSGRACEFKFIRLVATAQGDMAYFYWKSLFDGRRLGSHQACETAFGIPSGPKLNYSHRLLHLYREA
jgi:hypothetical protein